MSDAKGLVPAAAAAPTQCHLQLVLRLMCPYLSEAFKEIMQLLDIVPQGSSSPGAEVCLSRPCLCGDLDHRKHTAE
jgi:hypothetical protein